jgi:hypothetical protein
MSVAEDWDIESLIDWFHEPASLICSGFDASDELRIESRRWFYLP